MMTWDKPEPVKQQDLEARLTLSLHIKPILTIFAMIAYVFFKQNLFLIPFLSNPPSLQTVTENPVDTDTCTFALLHTHQADC